LLQVPSPLTTSSLSPLDSRCSYAAYAARRKAIIRSEAAGFGRVDVARRRKPHITLRIFGLVGDKLVEFGRRRCAVLRKQSFHRLQQFPRVTQQVLNLLAPGDRVAGEQAVPARVLVSPRRAGSRTAVRAAAPFTAQRRLAAGSAGPAKYFREKVATFLC
jgi:hypothetical protein